MNSNWEIIKCAMLSCLCILSVSCSLISQDPFDRVYKTAKYFEEEDRQPLIEISKFTPEDAEHGARQGSLYCFTMDEPGTERIMSELQFLLDHSDEFEDEIQKCTLQKKEPKYTLSIYFYGGKDYKYGLKFTITDDCLYLGLHEINVRCVGSTKYLQMILDYMMQRKENIRNLIKKEWKGDERLVIEEYKRGVSEGELKGSVP